MSNSKAFAELCAKGRDKILTAWKDAVFSTYPLNTVGFARTQEDQFCNPAGHATREALEKIYAAVAGQNVSAKALAAAVEMFIKLRAVQNFTPAEALGVLYLLKPLLREQILPACADKKGLFKELLEAESRLDTAVLLACNIYVASKVQVCEERIGEIKRQQSQITRWAQKIEGPTSAV